MDIIKGQIGLARALWFKWRSLKQIPFRKKFLVGNTYWEFYVETKSERMRRIIEYGTKRHHGDQDIAPQCMMWLRRTRPDFPSLQELALDLQRQEQMKVLAQQADERWKKGSLLRNEGLTPEQQQRLASITGGLHQQDIKHQEEDRAKATSVPVLETPIQLANINPRR